MNDLAKASTWTDLIASAQIEGVAVYDVRGDKIGAIKDVYLSPRSGHADFVSVASGGLLGVGEKIHPLPWSALHFDEALGGYLTPLEKASVDAAPTIGEDGRWQGPARDYYARYFTDAARPASELTATPPNSDPSSAADKTDHLAAKVSRSEGRQEALLDAGVEETFPASDPVSVKRLT